MKFKVYSPRHTIFAAIHLVDQLNKIDSISAELVSYINILDKSIYIIYCAQGISQLPVNYIVYQTEVHGTRHFTDRYLRIIKNALAVWEYSEANVHCYRNSKISIVSPGISVQKKVKKDIPVLFYGWLNDRRKNILLGINCSVRIVQNSLGVDMWKILNRTKVVVNVHFYDQSPLELFRVNESLSHHCHVVSEGPVNDSYLDHVSFVESGGCFNEKINKLLDINFKNNIKNLDNFREIESALKIL